MLVTESVKMFLFARWLATCYADEQVDAKMRYSDNEDFDKTTAMSSLNRESGNWYKGKLEYFSNIIYPEYVKNGTVKNTELFLSN